MLYKNTPTELFDAFLAFIDKHQLLENNGTTLLAVSGGLDSVVMVNLFHRAQLKFAIAHANFGLRGKASQEDEEFVGQMAQYYQVNYYTKNFETLSYSQQYHLSIQMAARKLRYQWFEELCQQYHLDRVATAHHNQDVIETVLLNFTKGTGISGLHGILPRKDRIIRPLLFADKTSLLSYAQLENIAWREDSSNAQDTYLRNLIRHQVLPALYSINPNFSHTSQLTLERLLQVDLLFQEQLSNIRKEILLIRGRDYELMLQSIQGKPWASVVIWELLKPLGFNFVQIKQLLSNKMLSGKHIYSNTYQLYVDRDKWIITPHSSWQQANCSIPDANLETLQIAKYMLKMRILLGETYLINTSKQVAALDLDTLEFPLMIRNWKPGDSFYPLGMQKPKKVSDFLIDIKVPRPYKKQIQVLVSNHKIVWLINHRIDDRFKITDHTQKVYEISALTHFK